MSHRMLALGVFVAAWLGGADPAVADEALHADPLADGNATSVAPPGDEPGTGELPIFLAEHGTGEPGGGFGDPLADRGDLVRVAGELSRRMDLLQVERLMQFYEPPLGE